MKYFFNVTHNEVSESVTSCSLGLHVDSDNGWTESAVDEIKPLKNAYLMISLLPLHWVLWGSKQKLSKTKRISIEERYRGNRHEGQVTRIFVLLYCLFIIKREESPLKSIAIKT